MNIRQFFSKFHLCNYSKVEKPIEENKTCFQLEEDNEAKQIFSTIDAFLNENECEYMYNWKYDIFEKILTHQDIDNRQFVGKKFITAVNDISKWWHYEHTKNLEHLDYLLTSHSLLKNGKMNEKDIDWSRLDRFMNNDRNNIHNDEYVKNIYDNELQKEKEQLKSMVKTAKEITIFFH